MLSAFSRKAFESVEKVISLNMDLAKASLQESKGAAEQLLKIKDPQEFMAFTSAQAQPNAQKVISYGRDLASIATSTQAEISKEAEAHIAGSSRNVIAMVDDVAKNAPAGSENVVALVKSAVGNVSAGYEQLNKNTKMAVEAVEANVAKAVNQFAQAAEKSAVGARG
jgi:phasin family protein